MKQKGPNETCDALDSCLAPYFCVQQKCAPLNLACAPASAGQGCAYLRVCDDSSRCDLTTFTCKARAAIGETCTTDDGCKAGYCSGGKCAALLASGASCASEVECASGLHCVTGKCAPGPAGDPCDRYDGPFCPDGYFCDHDVCAAGTAGQGQSCSSTGPGCVAGFGCVSGMCATRKPLGATCNYTNEACVSGICDSSYNLCLKGTVCKAP